MFAPIPVSAIPQEWEGIAALIRDAVGHDESVDLATVRGWLVSGQSEAFHVKTDAADGVVVTTIDLVDGIPVCWLNYIGGTIRGGPKSFVAEVRRITDEIEVLAKAAGCLELRGGGRNWSRVFPDWERFDPEYPNRMKKVLHG